MKKIPTVFEREYKNHEVVGISDTFTNEDTKNAFLEGIATIKYDGSCCAIIGGELYKRYDAKKGKTPPEGAIPCCEPDPVTGHHPHWVKCTRGNPADKWFFKAFDNYQMLTNEIENGTYEAVGTHFQGNPYQLNHDILVSHGKDKVEVDRTFEGVKQFLERQDIEGLVFWLDGEPAAKIKKTDFGFQWR